MEQALYAVVLLAAFGLRIWDVGSRAMHGDEAEHAWFAWHLYNGTGYQYDPVYHGPLQFIVTALFYFLFGVSEVTGRLLAVLVGTALVALPFFLRHYLGRAAALISSGFIAISPAFVYDSRLERDDILTAFFAMAMVIAIFSYLRTSRVRHIYIGAAVVALSLASMENTFITLFVFGSFLLLSACSELLLRVPPIERLSARWHSTGTASLIGMRPLLIAPLLLGLALALTIWRAAYPPVPLVLGLLLIALVHRQTVMRVTADPYEALSRKFSGVTPQQWLNAITILVAILFLTFSTFGTNLRGIWDSTQPLLNSVHGCQDNHYFLNPCRKDFIGGLFYWLSQHKVARGGQPWFYYSFLFTLYEQIAVVLGLAGVVWFVRRPTFFTSFLIYWAVLMFGIYSWAGEKFPWLMIHPLLPFTLLAAMFVVQVFQSVRSARWVLAALIALLTLLELHGTYEANFVHAADPVEMMVYVQSAPDTPKVAQQILTLSNKVTGGVDMNMTIDNKDTWPFAWYLRDMSHIGYVAPPSLLHKPYSTNPAIILDESNAAALSSQLAGHYTGRRYWLRWWFPEDYKSLSWGSFGQDLHNGRYWNIVLQWLIHRRPFGQRQGVHFYYYVKNGLASPY